MQQEPQHTNQIVGTPPPPSSPEPPAPALPVAPAPAAEVPAPEPQAAPVKVAKPRQQRPSYHGPLIFRPDTAASTTAALPADSVAADSLARHAVKKGIILKDPNPAPRPAMHPAASATGASDLASWVILGVLVLILGVALRMRRNMKYLRTFLAETVSARSRQNMFVDTMRETALSFMLNLMGVAGIGLFLALGVQYYPAGEPLATGSFPSGLWPCLALSGGYFVVQWIAYLFIGNIFASQSAAALWARGFRAGHGLLGLVLLPLALVGVFYPTSMPVLLPTASGLYILARLLFIYKGIRIFSGRHTYYLLFLYYLCTVEIVPVILIWHAASLWR